MLDRETIFIVSIFGIPIAFSFFFGEQSPSGYQFSKGGLILGVIISICVATYVYYDNKRNKVCEWGLPRYSEPKDPYDPTALDSSIGDWESLEDGYTQQEMLKRQRKIDARAKFENDLRKRQELYAPYAEEAQRLVDQFLDAMRQAGKPGIAYERLTDMFRGWGGWCFIESEMEGNRNCFSRNNGCASFVRQDGWWQIPNYIYDDDGGRQLMGTFSPANPPSKAMLDTLRINLFKVLKRNGVDIPR